MVLKVMGRKPKEKADKSEVSFEEYYAAQQELEELQKKYGVEEEPKKEGRISRKISSFFDNQENRELVAINKKKYIWLLVLTGWFGGHRFYVKHYKVGLFYLLFFWMGMGVYHSIIDLMAVIPMEPDENGNILL